MRKFTTLLMLYIGISMAHALTANIHSAKGVVISINSIHRSITISCAAIPNYMGAMEMPFTVGDPKSIIGLKPGSEVSFNIVEQNKRLYAENVREVSAINYESEPMEAGSLAFLHKAIAPTDITHVVSIGQPVPDFTLTDQADKKIHLAMYKGKVIVLTFGYSRCPYPTYCFRLSNNLARIAKRFHDRAGKDLVLMTVVIDPEHDQRDALKKYAETWNANPKAWHFLTGSMVDVKYVAGLFGMTFWASEGLLTHSLHTVIIDKSGKLTANLSGNQFTAKQIGDLVQNTMNQP